MKKQSKFLCLILLAMFAIKCPTKADVLVSTGFDTGYTPGAFSAQSGSGDVGLSGTWSSGSETTVVAATGSNNLTYNVAGGGTISSGSNVIQFTDTTGGSVELPFSRNVTSAISGENVYMSLVISAPVLSSNSGTDLDFFANDSASGTYGKIQGTGVGQFGSANAGAGIGNAYSGNGLASSTTAVTSTPTLLVAEFNWDSANSVYDSVSLWVDPNATQGLPDATATTLPINGTTSIQHVGLAEANVGTGTYDFDSLTIGTKWTDVVPQAAIPEPSTWALMVAGLAALFPALRRRFKMNN